MFPFPETRLCCASIFMLSCISSIKYSDVDKEKYKERNDVQNYKSGICKVPRSDSKSVCIEGCSSLENLWGSEVSSVKNKSLKSIVQSLSDVDSLFQRINRRSSFEVCLWYRRSQFSVASGNRGLNEGKKSLSKRKISFVRPQLTLIALNHRIKKRITYLLIHLNINPFRNSLREIFRKYCVGWKIHHKYQKNTKINNFIDKFPFSLSQANKSCFSKAFFLTKKISAL